MGNVRVLDRDTGSGVSAMRASSVLGGCALLRSVILRRRSAEARVEVSRSRRVEAARRA